MGNNPSHFRAGRGVAAGTDTSNWPVESATWHEAVEFCENAARMNSRLVGTTSLALLAGSRTILGSEAVLTIPQINFATVRSAQVILAKTVRPISSSLTQRFGSPTRQATACFGGSAPPESSAEPPAMGAGGLEGGRPTSKQSLEKVSGHFLRRIRHLSE